MDRSHIEALLNDVRENRTTVQDALERLRDLPFEDMGFAKLDHHRSLRTGMPEVIFASGKTTTQVAQIFERMANAGGNVLATRASKDCFEAVSQIEPRATYHETARAITLEQTTAPAGKGNICVVCAGTSDLPVAEEAAVTARLMGNNVELIADVGVAGIHRLLAQKSSLQGAKVLIVCAGAGGADERGLRRLVWRRGSAAGHAEYLLAQRLCGEYRQWVWSGLYRFAHQSYVVTGFADAPKRALGAPGRIHIA